MDVEEDDILRVCFRGGTLGWMLSWLELAPIALIFLVNGVGLFSRYPWGLFFVYNYAATVVYVVSYLQNRALRAPWDVGFEDCDFSPYALPDPPYVTVATFSSIIAAMALSRTTSMRVFIAVPFAAIAGLYTFARFYNAYQPVWYLIHDMVLVLLWTVLWVTVYLRYINHMARHFKESRLTRFINVDDGWRKGAHSKT